MVLSLFLLVGLFAGFGVTFGAIFVLAGSGAGFGVSKMLSAFLGNFLKISEKNDNIRKKSA